MTLALRRFPSWPVAVAVIFILVPPGLFYLHPSSFWASNDYQTHGLADALNLAYRIGDLTMYPARGMMDHPGVPYYFMNWLALALAGYPVASRDTGFYVRAHRARRNLLCDHDLARRANGCLRDLCVRANCATCCARRCCHFRVAGLAGFDAGDIADDRGAVD